MHRDADPDMLKPTRLDDHDPELMDAVAAAISKDNGSSVTLSEEGAHGDEGAPNRDLLLPEEGRPIHRYGTTCVAVTSHANTIFFVLSGSWLEKYIV